MLSMIQCGYPTTDRTRFNVVSHPANGHAQLNVQKIMVIKNHDLTPMTQNDLQLNP